MYRLLDKKNKIHNFVSFLYPILFILEYYWHLMKLSVSEKLLFDRKLAYVFLTCTFKNLKNGWIYMNFLLTLLLFKLLTKIEIMILGNCLSSKRLLTLEISEVTSVLVSMNTMRYQLSRFLMEYQTIVCRIGIPNRTTTKVFTI